MGEISMVDVDEVRQAHVSVWNYIYSWVQKRTLQCAVELMIPHVIEKHGCPISLSQLSSLVGCPSSSIFRIMRYLTYKGIFNKIITDDQLHYTGTPLSRLFTRDNMAPFILLQVNPREEADGISAQTLRTGKPSSLGLVDDGSENMWTDEFYSQGKLFTDSMECHAKITTTSIIDNHPNGFEGVGSLVDVGGRHGLAVGMLVDTFPSIRGINFDLPQVVTNAPRRDGIVHVGGDMFESIPKADAVMLMWVLHDWSDKACVNILKKCKETIPADTGKVMIVDAIIDKEGEEDNFAGPRLALDIVMMALTAAGKERTYEEWVNILDAAGFTRHKIINIGAIEYVIEAYP